MPHSSYMRGRLAKECKLCQGVIFKLTCEKGLTHYSVFTHTNSEMSTKRGAADGSGAVIFSVVVVVFNSVLLLLPSLVLSHELIKRTHTSAFLFFVTGCEKAFQATTI